MKSQRISRVYLFAVITVEQNMTAESAETTPITTEVSDKNSSHYVTSILQKAILVNNYSMQKNEFDSDSEEENSGIRKQDRVIADGSDYVDAMTLKDYNNRGWAYRLLTKEDIALLNKEKFAKAFISKTTPKTKDGAKVVEVNNKLLFVRGTFNNPIIENVVVFNASNVDDSDINQMIFLGEKEYGQFDKRSFAKWKSIREDIYGKGLFMAYSREDYQASSRRDIQNISKRASQPDGYQGFGYFGSFTVRNGVFERNESGVPGGNAGFDGSGSDDVEAYTKEQYNDFGWARANNVLTAKENSFLRSKFADALSHQANPPKSKSGESRLLKEFAEEMERKDSTLRQRFSKMLGVAVEKLKTLFQKYFGQYQSNSDEAQAIRKFTENLNAIQKQFDALLERKTATNEREEQTSQQKENTSERGVMQMERGVASDGRKIYESNFPKGTPKYAKSQRILDYIKNVWSKTPISLVISNGETSRTIFAKFDPTVDESKNIYTDATKIAGGNRHGSSAEQRVTLDLADDYYQIATDSKYNYSKIETGKKSNTHKDVKMWHYFVNDIYFAEYGEKVYVPYTVTINVKERESGEFVYSFNAEKESSTRRTLHADVNTVKGANGELFLVDSISNSGKKVKENFDIRKQDRVIADGSDYIEAYTKEQYNDFGWARANNVLTAKENADLRSKFADALSHQANPPKSKQFIRIETL